MARTRKSTSLLNLHKYDVLIEDTSTRSDYFKISQFDGYFYGGRNAFLVAGTGVLKPNSKILVEVLNKDGTPVYSAPVSQFIEGNSRLVQIEVYSDTPIGPGKIVLLGCADFFKDGAPVPNEWKDRFNVRWTTDVIISPRVENKTPIRFVKPPSLLVEEKFYLEPSSSAFIQRLQAPLDIEFEPTYLNVFQNGYLLRITGPTTSSAFSSEYLNGRLTGSLQYVTPTTTESLRVELPITKIFNDRLAESRGNLLYTDKKTLISSGFFSSSVSYNTNINSLGNVYVTGALSLEYDKLEAVNTIFDVSYAKIRVVNLSTISGEIHKIRISYRPSAEPGEYIILGDVNTAVTELFAVDSASRIVETGKFTNDLVRDDYWYTATMSLQKNQIEPVLPPYYYSSSLVPEKINSSQSDLLDGINASPVIIGNSFIDDVSYFVGNRSTNYITLFPGSEYTLKFDAIANKYSGSVELIQPDYSMEVYLVPQEPSGSSILTTDSRGQLLGVLKPNNAFSRQNFENTQFNFTPNIKDPSVAAIRFVVYGGWWSLANVSVKTATENLFSPDEVDILLQNVNFKNKVLTFKAEYLDVNNNSIGITTLSTPRYFFGSTTPFDSSSVASSSYALTASYAINAANSSGQSFPYTGSAIISGSLRVTGSLEFTQGGTYVTGSATIADIEGVTLALNSQYLVLSQSSELSNERVLSLSNRFSTSDGGAGNNYTVDLSNNIRTSTVGVVIDGGGVPITVGEKVELLIPFSASIQSWYLLADRSGSVTVDIWKSSYATYPSTISNSITATARPFISNSIKNTSSTLTGWNTNIARNDTLKFYVSASSTIQRVNLTLELLRI